MTTDEYAGLELGHVVEQINSLNTARTQVAALFGTVNLAILGTALSTSKAGLFLFGAASVTLAGTVDQNSGPWSSPIRRVESSFSGDSPAMSRTRSFKRSLRDLRGRLWHVQTRKTVPDEPSGRDSAPF